MSQRSLIAALFCGLLLTLQPMVASANSFVEQPSGQRRLIVFVHGLGNSGGEDPQLAWSSSTADKSWPSLMNRDASFHRNFAIFVAQYSTEKLSGNFPIQGLAAELGSVLKTRARI